MRNTSHVKSFMKNWMNDMVHDVLMIDDRSDIPKPEYEGYLRHMNDMAPLNALLAVRNDYFVMDNDRKLKFLARIWPREIEYQSENPKRRI